MLPPVAARVALSFGWRGFELHPEIPDAGIALRDLFPPAAVAAMAERLRSVAADLGVPLRMPDFAPCTRPALALSELARERGVLDRWRDAVMDAYWRDGRDIGRGDVLTELAGAAGLDPREARAFLGRPEIPAILRRQREEAARWGVTGIPTWFFLPEGWRPQDGIPDRGPRPVRLVGCQPVEVVLHAARLAGAAPVTESPPA